MKPKKRVQITSSIELAGIPSDVETKGVANVNDSLKYGEVEVIVSNSGTDRHGEQIIMNGIDLAQIKRNPVLLWAHQYSELPIGSILKIWKESGNLMARIKLAYDVYDFADTVYKMIVNGIIRAVSIGGIVKEWNEDYTIIKKMEMIELSVVPVGAHPDALVTAKSIGIKKKALKEQFDTFVQTSLVDKVKSLSDNEKTKYSVVLRTLADVLDGQVKPQEPSEAAVKHVQKVIKFKILHK